LLHKSFPDIPQRHHGRFLQAFVHPSFTTSAGVSGTMQPLVPVGEALLEKVCVLWILSTFDGIRREEYTSLLALLTGDTALCRILRDHWTMEHMVLTDASADLFSKERLNSSKGMVRWLAAQGSAGGMQALPEPYAAGCVKAMVAAVLLEHGYDTANRFVASEVLPYLL
jgi:dsRNA-specific ribonuclease